MDTSDRRLIQDLIDALKGASRGNMSYFAGGRNDQRMEFAKDGSGSSDPVENMQKKVEEFNKRIEESNKSFRELEKNQKNVFKGMISGVPVLKDFVKATQASTNKINELTRGQSKAYSESAQAVSDFADKAGASAKELGTVNNTLSQVYDAGLKLSKVSKERHQIEVGIYKSFKNTALETKKLEGNLSNTSELIEKTKDRINSLGSSKKDVKEKKKLEAALEKLEQLDVIPKQFDELKKIMSDPKLKDVLANNPELKKLFGKTLKAVESADTPDELIDQMDKLEDVLDSLRGSLEAKAAKNEQQTRKQVDALNNLNDSLQNLGKAISAALGEAIVKESMMLMTRQRLTGAPMAYAAREQALRMGMSETDALTSLTENRYLMRMIARDTGMATGAGELLQSGQLNELRVLSREMGLLGKDALDNLVRVSNDLRVIGAHLSERNISGMIGFVRDSFKDLGLTQEQMRQFFGEMSREGMLRTMVAGPDARFASIEAIQQEVKFRGQLARTLNQELDIQKKRVQQLTKLAYGDPGEALRQSIGVQILAKNTGMSQADAQLLAEFTRTGGKSKNLTQQEKDRAKILSEELDRRIGKSLDIAATEDSIGQRGFLTQMIRVGGRDAEQAVEAFTRAGGVYEGMTVDEVVAHVLANTDREANEEIPGVLDRLATAFEFGQGVLKSAIGASTTAIVGAISGWGANIVAANLAGARGIGMGAALRGMGRGAGRGAKNAVTGKWGRRIGGGVGLGIAGSMTRGMTQGTKYESAGGIGSSALTGAAIGSVLGVKGAAVGGVLGGAYGIATELFRDRQTEGAEEIESALGPGYGGSKVELTGEKRNEIKQAIRSGEHQKAKQLMAEGLRSQESVKTRGLTENFKRWRSQLNVKDSMERVAGQSHGSLAESYREQAATAGVTADKLMAEMSGDVTSLIESGDYREIISDEGVGFLKDILEEDDVENTKQEELFRKINEWLELDAEERKEQTEAIKEGNKQDARHYGEMSEGQIEATIDRELAGVRERLYGTSE